MKGALASLAGAVLMACGGCGGGGGGDEAPAPPAAVAPVEQPLPVYLLLGQSNMVGMRSDVAALPPSLVEPQPSTLFYKEGGWIPLAPGVSEGRGFGPEISFGKRMSANGKVGIIKLAAGDTSLYTQWNVATPNGLYAKTLALVADAAKARPIKVAGVVWVQGESDGATADMANAYSANFVAFVSSLRRDLKSPDLPIAACRETAPADQYPFTEVVRAAQVSAPIPNYKWLDCDGLTKTADNLHYDTAGQVKLGELFADAAIALGAAP